MKYKNLFKFSAPLLIGGLLAAAIPAVGQNIKLNPIKPASKTAVTDEQQAILAVRAVKASVVSIVGTVNVDSDINKPLDNTFGTGFVVDSEGYIISNNHVVGDKDAEFTVVFADGREFKARVVGLDKYADIALLKIDGGKFPALALGDSDGLETGQTVFAIGNSLGRYQNTVTRGVVSGLGRDVSVDEDNNPRPRLKNLIQTDASINPGNSGGPLINLLGEVVGMNTVVDRGGEGLGFAVAVNEIKSVLPQLKTLGKVPRPYLGISYQTINKAVRLSRKLPQSQEGAYIVAIAAQSPAQSVGLMPGDVITAVNRQALSEKVELDSKISKYSAGNQILLTLQRGGQQLELPVILGEYK